MIKIRVIILFFMLSGAFLAYPQDNRYGDILISSIQKPISLDLEKAKLLDVVKMLSQQTGLNFVSTEAVQERSLTLYVENVFLKEAIDVIFRANNLAYDYYPEANIFVIKEMGKPTIELMTKVFHLKYARVGISKMQTEISVKLGAGTCDAIKNALVKVMSSNGSTTEDSVTNTLIITDVPVQFPQIEKVISDLDIPPPQVMIEVEMLDVSKRLVDQIGIRYNRGEDSNWATLSPTSRTTFFPWDKRFIEADSTPATPSTLSLVNLQMSLQLFTKDSSTKFLARPKILTIANDTAEVNITTDEVIGLERTTTTQEGVSTYTDTAVREETGTKLRVTPQVNMESNEITLFVEVFNKEAKASGVEINDQEVSNVEERGTKSLIRLKDGETILIGGLIRKNEGRDISKVPFLGDIPLIGNIFRYKDADKEERELLIFLTPHIIGKISSIAEGGSLSREQGELSFKRGVISSALDKLSRM